MDRVTTMTPEIERELHELRERAYGPGAGAGLDAGEAERLEELESRARAVRVAKKPASTRAAVAHEALEVGPAETPAAAMTPESRQRTQDDGSPDASAALDIAEAPAAASFEDPTTTRAHRWWRSRAVWIGVAAGAVVGALIASTTYARLTPPPDTTLHVIANPEGIPSDLSGMAAYIGVDVETLVRFDDWKSFEVSMGTQDDGDECLLVMAQQAILDFGCGFDGLSPQVDLWVHNGMASLIGGSIPTGSTIRFVARGDTIDVWEQLSETVSAE